MNSHYPTMIVSLFNLGRFYSRYWTRHAFWNMSGLVLPIELLNHIKFIIWVHMKLEYKWESHTTKCKVISIYVFLFPQIKRILFTWYCFKIASIDHQIRDKCPCYQYIMTILSSLPIYFHYEHADFYSMLCKNFIPNGPLQYRGTHFHHMDSIPSGRKKKHTQKIQWILNMLQIW